MCVWLQWGCIDCNIFKSKGTKATGNVRGHNIQMHSGWYDTKHNKTKSLELV